MFPLKNTPTDRFPYRIEREVGRGSMGVVYQAHEVALERPVAIKALLDSASDQDESHREEVKRRFLQEARSAAALSHPGITTVYRVGQEVEVPYIVMEWLEGNNLEQILTAKGRLRISQSVRIVLALLDALEIAHRGGVVHRDIKPSNIMLLRDGRLKVTDFGIATFQGRELVQTQAGVVLATPKYASPEQLQGARVDGRSDLFSTGILLYHLLTHKYPFEGDSFMELATAVLQKPPVPIRNLLPDLPPALDGIIQTALRKNRDDRFQSASEMADRLRTLTGQGSAEVAAATTATAQQPAATTSAGSLDRKDLPQDAKLAIVNAVCSWPGKQMGQQRVLTLLDRLLEKPLHAPAFAGALKVDNTCLFLYDGLLLGAVDQQTGLSGDEVAESLPSHANPTLYPVPESLSGRIIPLMTTLLMPPRLRHADLDTTYINLPAMVQKLKEEGFDGLLRLQRGAASGWIFFDRGQDVLSLYSGGWDGVPLDQSWQRWVSKHNVRASIEEKAQIPLGLWYRKALRNFVCNVEPVEVSGDALDGGKKPGSTITRIFQTPRSTASGSLLLRVSPAKDEGQPEGVDTHYEQDPIFRFLSWSLDELPRFLEERERISRWKYLSEWLSLVRRARLHHDLPRPGSRDADLFDLVTTNGQGKVLHIGQRVAKASAASLQQFKNKVIEAKTARKKTGDVGGAFLIAPSFDEDTLKAYGESVQETKSGRWFAVEESFTGYEGFVRIGPRRGFHLMLVREREQGFEPLLA